MRVWGDFKGFPCHLFVNIRRETPTAAEHHHNGEQWSRFLWSLDHHKRVPDDEIKVGYQFNCPKRVRNTTLREIIIEWLWSILLQEILPRTINDEDFFKGHET